MNCLNKMVRIRTQVFAGILLLSAICPFSVVAKSNSELYNVLDYGAIGDGNTDDTQAFVKAWEATCKSSAAAATSIMHVPSNKIFLIHPVEFEGPCNSPEIILEINGEITAPEEPSEWRFNDDDHHRWIHISEVDGLSVQGGGTINGRGNKWWNKDTHPGHKGPNAMEISSSENVGLRDLNFKDNPRVHLTLNSLRSANLSNITIHAPGDSPNTDGIHVTGSTDVTIDTCIIRTGDDCISIVDGSKHLNISNIVCGPGHGISIGSLGKDGATDEVEYVEVRDVVFVKTQNGARIKTWGGKGHAMNIIFERILSQESKNPIIIDQFYCDHEECTTQDSAVEITNITFRQVIGTSESDTAVTLQCSNTVPCREIVLDDIYILSKDNKTSKSECSNAQGRIQRKSLPNIPCLGQ